MPRKAREYSSTGIYHIVVRGNDRSDLFYEDQDRYVFLDRLMEVKEKYNFEIYSYCLMSNHIHNIIKIKEEFLSKAMQSLEISYSSYIKKKYNRSGYLFENRFFSKRIESLEYFLTACKYIHRNPEKANIEKTEKYKWSSYHEYVGIEKIINKDILLHYYNNNVNEFREDTLLNDDVEILNKLAEYELFCKLPEDELIKIINKKFELNNPSDISLFEKEKKDYILKKLKQISGTSINQLSRVTKITPYYIKKVWEKK